MNEHATPRRPAATYRDVLDAPEHVVAEIARSELHLSPRPASRQALASDGLLGMIDGRFRRGAGGPGDGGSPWSPSSISPTTCALGGDDEVACPPFAAVPFCLATLWPD